jgi:hypothetical protein
MQDLFARELLNKANVKKATTFASAIAMNNGSGRFELQSLPVETQLSCVCGIYCDDIDGDGATDLLLGGNDYGFVPQFSRLDASLLINDGSGKFTPVPSARSGFFVKGEIRNVEPVVVDGVNHVVIGINNQAPVLYKIESK